MATGVFISWSGDFSKKLAEELKVWLEDVLQHVEPYLSADSIEKGEQWFNNMTEKLKNTKIGLLCLTPDNKEKPWILFEAGALSKGRLEARVCPLVFNLKPTDLKGPLANFQATKFQKDDFRKLVKTINDKADGNGIDNAKLDRAFDRLWPELEKKVKAILAEGGSNETEDPREVRDIVEEILEHVRRPPPTASLLEKPGFPRLGSKAGGTLLGTPPARPESSLILSQMDALLDILEPAQLKALGKIIEGEKLEPGKASQTARIDALTEILEPAQLDALIKTLTTTQLKTLLKAAKEKKASQTAGQNTLGLDKP